MRLAVVNLKGGVGKTTTTMHLAVGLGRRVATVLVDADPKASASRWAQLAPDLPCRTVAHPRPDLARRLDGLVQGAEHVLIDTPPGHESIVQAAISVAGLVLIPVEPYLMDLDRLAPTIDLMTQVTQHGNPDVFILLTRVRTGTHSVRGAREVLEGRGLPVLATEIPLLEAYGWGYGLVPPEGHRYGALLDELLSSPVPA